MRTFNEKKEEYSRKAKASVRVWQADKYKESKRFAGALLDSGQYDLAEADFWILQNDYGDKGYVQYAGLIISHNGCLKINDHLEEGKRFRPECVSEPFEMRGSLVMAYSCPEQGIYEFGEVSKENCKNDYPFAMVIKRLFDRVVLKNSRIAYAGIYSDSEAEEFRKPVEEMQIDPNEKAMAYQIEELKRFYKGQNEQKLFAAQGITKWEDLSAEVATRLLSQINRNGTADDGVEPRTI